MSEPLTFEQWFKKSDLYATERNAGQLAWNARQPEIDDKDAEIERLTRERDAAEAAALERAVNSIQKFTEKYCQENSTMDFETGFYEPNNQHVMEISDACDTFVETIHALIAPDQSSALEQVEAQARLEEAEWWQYRSRYTYSGIKDLETERKHNEEVSHLAELEAAAGRKS